MLLCNIVSIADIKVGVFLPFKAQGAESQRAIEYYRGLLMAVDSLSQDGTTFSVTAADCGTTASDMMNLIDESKNGVFDIVFAPSNVKQLEVLNNYSRLNGTKLVVPFGGRYDELVINPNFFALKVTQTDFTTQAYKLITTGVKNKNIYVVSTNGGKEISTLANYIVKYVKGAKLLEWPAKEAKVLHALTDANALIVPSMYDADTQDNILKLVRKANGAKAAVVGYPQWYERAQSLADRKNLCEMNAYVINPGFPRYGLPRVKKFITEYEANFETKHSQEAFSFALWGFDTGYYMLKGLGHHKMEFYDQKLYSAPLQNGFRFEPRATLQGLINTMVLLIHYKTDGTQELIEAKE